MKRTLSLILTQFFLTTSLFPSYALALEKNLPSLTAKKTFSQAQGLDLLRQRAAKDGGIRDELKKNLETARDGGKLSERVKTLVIDQQRIGIVPDISKTMELKTFPDSPLMSQYNPHRKERLILLRRGADPLEEKNRPKGQEVFAWQNYEIGAQIAPIVPGHLTLWTKQPEAQAFSHDHAADFVDLLQELDGFVVIYNHPNAGPTNLLRRHFQAFPKTIIFPNPKKETEGSGIVLPILTAPVDPEALVDREGARVSQLSDYLLPAFVVEGTREGVLRELNRVIDALLMEELTFNLLGEGKGQGTSRVIVVPRTKGTYEGKGIAAFEVAGFFVWEKREDFDAYDAAQLEEILKAVTPTKDAEALRKATRIIRGDAYASDGGKEELYLTKEEVEKFRRLSEAFQHARTYDAYKNIFQEIRPEDGVRLDVYTHHMLSWVNDRDREKIIGILKKDRVAERLVMLLRSPNHSVKKFAVAHLPDIELSPPLREEAIARLEAFISNQSKRYRDIRPVAILSLSELDLKRPLSYFEAIAQGENKSGLVKWAVELVLEWRSQDSEKSAQDGSRKDVSSLLIALLDENSDVRLAAAVALGKRGDVRALPGLLATLSTNKERAVREAAAVALGKISGNSAALPYLIDLLKNPKTSKEDLSALRLLTLKALSHKLSLPEKIPKDLSPSARIYIQLDFAQKLLEEDLLKEGPIEEEEVIDEESGETVAIETREPLDLEDLDVKGRGVTLNEGFLRDVQELEEDFEEVPSIGGKLYFRNAQPEEKMLLQLFAALFGEFKYRESGFLQVPHLILPYAQSYMIQGFLLSLLSELLPERVMEARFDLEVSLEGRRTEDVKYIALSRLIMSPFPYDLENYEESLMGQFPPIIFGGKTFPNRTDFLTERLIGKSVVLQKETAVSKAFLFDGLAQLQLLTTALKAYEKEDKERTPSERRLAQIWKEFQEGLRRLLHVEGYETLTPLLDEKWWIRLDPEATHGFKVNPDILPDLKTLQQLKWQEEEGVVTLTAEGEFLIESLKVILAPKLNEMREILVVPDGGRKWVTDKELGKRTYVYTSPKRLQHLDDYIMEIIGQKPIHRVIDFGIGATLEEPHEEIVGPSATFFEFEQKLHERDATIELIGIDNRLDVVRVNQSHLAMQRRLDSNAPRNAEVFSGSFSEPVKRFPAQVDLIRAMNVFQHYPKKERIKARILLGQALREGGFLIEGQEGLFVTYEKRERRVVPVTLHYQETSAPSFMAHAAITFLDLDMARIPHDTTFWEDFFHATLLPDTLMTEFFRDKGYLLIGRPNGLMSVSLESIPARDGGGRRAALEERGLSPAFGRGRSDRDWDQVPMTPMTPHQQLAQEFLRIGGVTAADGGRKKVLSFEEIVQRIKTDPRVATPENLNVILETLSDPDGYVREAALEVIPSFHVNPLSFSEDNLKKVLERVADRDWHVRGAALRAIPSFIQADPKYATEDNLKKVLERVADRDWHVRGVALRAIPSFIQADPKHATEDNLLKAVLGRVADRDPNVRWVALRAIPSFIQADPKYATEDNLLKAVLGRVADSDVRVQEAALEVILPMIHPHLSDSFFQALSQRLPQRLQALDLATLARVNLLFQKSSLKGFFLGDQEYIKAYLYQKIKEGVDPERIQREMEKVLLPSLRILDNLLDQGNPTFGVEVHQVSPTREKEASLQLPRFLLQYLSFVQTPHQVAITDFVGKEDERRLEIRILPSHIVGLKLLLDELIRLKLIQVSPYTFTVGEPLDEESITILSSSFFFPTGYAELPYASSSQGWEEPGFPGIWSYTGATVDPKEGGAPTSARQSNIYARILGEGYEKELWRLGTLSLGASKYRKDPQSEVGGVYQDFKKAMEGFYRHYLGLDPETVGLLLGKGYRLPEGDAKVDESRLHQALKALQEKLKEGENYGLYVKSVTDHLQNLEKALFPNPFVLDLVKTAYTGDLEGVLLRVEEEARNDTSSHQALAQELLRIGGVTAPDGGRRAARDGGARKVLDELNILRQKTEEKVKKIKDEIENIETEIAEGEAQAASSDDPQLFRDILNYKNRQKKEKNDQIKALNRDIAKKSEEAVKTLAQLDPPAVPELLTLLKEKDRLVRFIAVRALAAIGPSAVNGLVAILQDKKEDQIVQAFSAWALGEIGDPGAIPPLLDAVKTGEVWYVRATAAWALGTTVGKSKVKSDIALETLNVAFKEEKDETVQRAIQWALDVIEGEIRFKEKVVRPPDLSAPDGGRRAGPLLPSRHPEEVFYP
ncbi:MAG: DUF4922 domain-containing protein [Candidatus Omnitrophica bacterium]|nr:DUF4922 domain-containing protein [Candidatus Omnitrophota bacterium]